MGFSLRLLVVDQTDRIHRLDVDRFSQILHEPKAHPFLQFAGQRLRWAEAVVELVERKPVRVVRMTFNILPFDQAGCLDRKTFDRYMLGRANLAFSSPRGTHVQDAAGFWGLGCRPSVRRPWRTVGSVKADVARNARSGVGQYEAPPVVTGRGTLEGPLRCCSRAHRQTSTSPCRSQSSGGPYCFQ